jgi:UDP-N-acetylglucosamine 2-epimerase (non-hydrolysing)
LTSVLVPLGTRPEIIKLAPVVREFTATGVGVRLLATGQHGDAAMSAAFFDELNMHPDETWVLPADPQARVAAILEGAERELATNRPDLVLVLGDTNTVPLFCLAARRNRVPVAHLEAGLRSFNATSMEEVNRKVAAACASLHLAPTDLAAQFLAEEGIDPAHVSVVGNPVIDVLRQLGVRRVGLGERSGAVLTAHRATNVDDPTRLRALVELVHRIADEAGTVTFPVHPRTRRRLEEGGLLGALAGAGVLLSEPVGYRAMSELVASSRLVVTDSGGLQEEASFFGVPVVVLRRSTPRWEGVRAGTSRLVGMDVALAMAAVRDLISPAAQQLADSTPCPYGDGHTAERVAKLLGERATWDLLRLDEPDFVGREPPA